MLKWKFCKIFTPGFLLYKLRFSDAGFLSISMTVRTKCSLGIFPEGWVHTDSQQAEGTEEAEDANL